MERTLSQRRSSCLLFQIIGVETYLLFPDDQRDRGNLPRQSQAGHRGLPPLSEQILVEIVQRSSSCAGSHRRTLKNIFEVVVVLFRPRTVAGLLERRSSPFTAWYCALSCVSNARPL